MSRITKFLMQRATISYMIRDINGEPILNEYGEPTYRPNKVTVACRREHGTKDVLTTGGAATVSTTRYFFDNSVDISIGDKVDGKPVLTVTDMINSLGKNEGWEVTV